MLPRSRVHGVAFVDGLNVHPIITYRKAGVSGAYRKIPCGFPGRDYGPTEAWVVVDWINGYDRPLPNMQPEIDDPLLGSHRKERVDESR